MSGIFFHDKAVQEVVDYLKQKRLFAVAPNCDVLRDIPAKLVDSLAGIPKYRDPDEDGALIEGDFNWNDLLQRTGREYHRATRDIPSSQYSEFSDRIRATFNDCWRYAEPHVRELLGTNYTYDVEGIIQGIMLTRAVCGVIPGHLDTVMWLALINGGFPCGWYGSTDQDRGGMLAVHPVWPEVSAGRA